MGMTEKNRKVIFLDLDKATETLLKMGGLLAYEDQVNEALQNVDWEEMEKIAAGIDDSWLRDAIKKKDRQPKWPQAWHAGLRVGNWVASTAGIVLSIFLILFFFVGPVRAQVIRFIAINYPDHSFYSPIIEMEEQQGADTVYAPSYIPNGFMLHENHTYDDVERFMIWQDGERMITFRQAIADDNTLLDTEDATVRNISINGEPAELITKNSFVTVYFVMDGLSFTVVGEADESTIIKIAESITIDK